MNELIAALNEYFRVIRADNARLLHEVFRLRYRIYCEETHLADRSLFPQQLERDEYDRHSIHVLLQHRPSGHYVGTVRLVLADPSNPLKRLPVEGLARFDRGREELPKALRRQVAEISRLAILRRFPHHQAGGPARYNDQTTIPKQRLKARLRFPLPTLALTVGIMNISVEHGITHWYAIMAPSLDRLLTHYGLHLRVAGPAFELYGTRRPHFDSIEDVLTRVYWKNFKIWELITDRGGLWPRPNKAIDVAATSESEAKRRSDQIDSC